MELDKLELAGVVIGAIGGVAGIVGAIAAVKAAIYAKLSATQDGLNRVEQNTAASVSEIAAVRTHIAQVEQHLGLQNRRDELERIAETVSIKVSAEGWNDEPFVFKFEVGTTGVALKKIDLTSRHGLLGGYFECRETDLGVYTGTVSSNTFAKWQNSGDIIPGGERRSVTIRAHFEFDGNSLERTFPVVLVMTLRQRPGATTYFYTVTGEC